MPAPERKFTQDFFDVNPPVIPVMFSRPKGRGKPGPMSQIGFDCFQLIRVGNDWRVVVNSDITLKCLGDGYAEIPDTERNRKLLAQRSKPQKYLPTYDRAISKDLHDPEKFWFRNNKGTVVRLTEETLDKGEIRLINKGGERPATVKKLKSLREFDVKNPRSTDSDLAQRARPWLQQFVKVEGAVMEAAAI